MTEKRKHCFTIRNASPKMPFVPPYTMIPPVRTDPVSVRNGPGRAGPDVCRPGLRAFYQAWPAALSAGFSAEKRGRTASHSGPSDRSGFISAGGTHTLKMSYSHGIITGHAINWRCQTHTKEEYFDRKD